MKNTLRIVCSVVGCFLMLQLYFVQQIDKSLRIPVIPELELYPCIEFSKLVNTKEAAELCPLSVEEWGCRETYNKVTPLLSILQTHETHTLITWKDVIIVLLTYNTPEQTALLQAHADTWMQHVGEGADIVLVTDFSDDRSLIEIMPQVTTLQPHVHLYKSNAMQEGKHPN